MRRVLTMIHTPTFGGPHTLVDRLYNPLAARGWEMIAVLPNEDGNGPERLRTAGIEVVQISLHRLRASLDPRLHCYFLFGLTPEIRQIRRLIREHRIDLVMVCGVMHPHGAIAAHLERTPVVWHLMSTLAPMPLRRVLMPIVTRLADVVMSTGVQVARQHPGAMRLGNRLIPYFMPVDTNRFLPDPRKRMTARAELGVPEDALLVGTVGNQNRQKAHELLVQAAAPVTREIPNAWFRILGAPTATQATYYEKQVKAEARSLGLTEGNRLAFVDPGERVADLLPAFDLFALTSRAEGVPTAILEAMACGLPVVATDVGSVREVVENNITGFVLPLLDPEAIARAITGLLRDPERRAIMGQTARERAVRLYDTSVCAETHGRAFEIATAYRRLRGRTNQYSTQDAPITS